MHRLITSTFLPTTPERNWVNHIDGDKLNNYISNLEWVTPKENSTHAVETGLAKKYKRVVIQYDITGCNVISRYDSTVDASSATGCAHQLIGKACLGKIATTGGFGWKYETPNIEPVDIEDEKWIDCDTKPYAVSNFGRVKNLTNGRILRQQTSRDGRKTINLKDEGMASSALSRCTCIS